MHKIKFFLPVVFLTIFTLQLATAQVIVRVKPVRPKKTIVVKRAKPRKGYLWVDAHWQWNAKRNKYVWVDGKYIRKKRGYRYVTGKWVNTRRGHKYVPGHWVRA